MTLFTLTKAGQGVATRQRTWQHDLQTFSRFLCWGYVAQL